MVAVATCSYGQYRPHMGLPVQISLGTPKWWDTPPPARIWSITPRYSYLRLPFEEYAEHYVSQLNRHGPVAIEQEFQRIAQQHHAERLVLLCFENVTKPDQWCHRTMFAEWWLQVTGEVVVEFGAPQPDTQHLTIVQDQALLF